MEGSIYSATARMEDGSIQTKIGDLITVADWADALMRESFCAAEINITRMEEEHEKSAV